MTTFKERVEEFWKWFKENEDKIIDFVQNPDKYTPEEITTFIGNGVEKAVDDAYFEVGLNNEFTFSTGGEHYLFYLLPYLVSKVPRDLKYNWIFSPYKLGGMSRDFSLQNDYLTVSINDVQVLVNYEDEGNVFSIEFYNEYLAKISEKEALNIFYILLDAAVGENTVELYIGPIDRLKKRKNKMINLSELNSYIENKLRENNQEFFKNPSECYSSYEFDPLSTGNLRDDIYVGSTCYFDIVEEFYNEEDDEMYVYNSIDRCGGKVAFISYEYDNEDTQRGLIIRNELLDRIEEEILGEKDSGNEIGIILGAATGTDRFYIDILLYDEVKFLDTVDKLLKDYNYKFSYSEFKRNPSTIDLLNKNSVH